MQVTDKVFKAYRENPWLWRVASSCDVSDVIFSRFTRLASATNPAKEAVSTPFENDRLLCLKVHDAKTDPKLSDSPLIYKAELWVGWLIDDKFFRVEKIDVKPNLHNGRMIIKHGDNQALIMHHLGSPAMSHLGHPAEISVIVRAARYFNARKWALEVFKRL